MLSLYASFRLSIPHSLHIFFPPAYKHRETHETVVKSAVVTTLSLVFMGAAYLFCPRDCMRGKAETKKKRERKTFALSTNNDFRPKEALDLKPVLYVNEDDEVVDSKDGIIIMENRDFSSSKLDEEKSYFEEEEDIMDFLKTNNLTSEMEETEDFLRPPVMSLPLISNSVDIILKSPRLSNLGFAQAHEVRIEFKCCKQPVAVTLVGTSISRSKRVLKCENCSRITTIIFSPRLIHQSCSTLGTICVEGDAGITSLSDVLQISIFNSCLSCGTRAVMPAIMPRSGQVSRIQCRSCFKQTEFECEGITMETEQMRRSERQTHKKKKNNSTVIAPTVPVPGLRIGTPLPNKGACKHFRKSYRFFRFPCCGRAFACPVCHEIGGTSLPLPLSLCLVHQHNSQQPTGCDMANGTYSVRATHEICGKCSVEQKIEGDFQVCSACKFNMGKRRGRAQFWSGGGGVRDNASLSKKDRRKKKKGGGGSSLKTTSKKSLRVGLKGKKEREKKKN